MSRRASFLCIQREGSAVVAPSVLRISTLVMGVKEMGRGGRVGKIVALEVTHRGEAVVKS